jgi:hypothetical protein
MGAVAATLALLVGTAGCAGSSRTGEDFQRKAEHTLSSAVSAVRTVEVAVDAADDGKLTSPFVSVVVNDADKDLNAVVAGFLSRQPPDQGADAQRKQVADLLTQAQEAVDAVRIAARRGQVRGLKDVAPQLPKIADAMETMQERLA